MLTHHFQEEGQLSTHTLIAKNDLNFSTKFPKSGPTKPEAGSYNCYIQHSVTRSADPMLPEKLVTGTSSGRISLSPFTSLLRSWLFYSSFFVISFAWHVSSYNTLIKTFIIECKQF